MRSLIPAHVNIMALTATVTHHTYNIVCRSLSLREPILIGSPPNRNICYEVKPLIDMNVFCDTVVRELKTQGLEYPKTIIFLQRYQECAALYQILRRKLGPCITYPPHYPRLPEFSITWASQTEMKEQILTSFCDPKTKLRIVLATTAFGMGVDCADVRVIYHWALQLISSNMYKSLGELVETIILQLPYCYMENLENLWMM